MAKQCWGRQAVGDSGPGPLSSVPHVSSGWYLTRIDPSRSALADLALNMKTDGSHGLHLFLVGTCGTSLTSLACEKLRGRLRLAVVEERPNGAGGFLDAERWWWITKDDDLNTLGDQGLSVGVVRVLEAILRGPCSPRRL